MKMHSTLAACLALIAGTANAQNQLSDLLRITPPGGAPVVFAIPEGGVAGAPETAIFNLPMLGPDGLYGGPLPPGAFAPIIGSAVMFEPAGAPIEPGEAPIFWPTATGQHIVSDIVVGFLTPNSPVAPTGVAFISYGDTNLATWAAFLMGGSVPVVTLDETGAFQDVSALVFLPPVAYKVEVQSDVPEPGTAALLLAGAGIVGWAARRRHSA
jgi:hypothetical protein